MERLELWIGIIIGITTIAGVLWKLGLKAIERLSKPIHTVKEQVDEILDKVTHNGNADRYLLKYRVEQLCFRVFAECKKNGV